MAFRIEFTILKPTIWLLSAAMVAAAALCLHYYQSQIDATRSLAMKLGLPATVAIEDFHRLRNSNQMGEVQLAALVRPADTRLVAGEGDRALYLLPLYSTEADFASDEPAPFGFYAAPKKPDAEGLSAFGLTEVTDLGEVKLVNAVGTRMNGQSALSGTMYEIAPADLGLDPNAFLVASALVERAARLGTGNVGTFRDILFFVSAALMIMAGVSRFHGRRRVTIGRPDVKPIPQASSPRSKKAFAPLASQDEIIRTDEAERARRRRSRLSFAATFAGDAANLVKNPR